MKFLDKQNLIWKYEKAFAFGTLAFQYILVAIFPSVENYEIERQYVTLWFFDIFFAFPILFLIYMPRASRIKILIPALGISAIIFFLKFGFNSIYFNTFLTLFLSHRFLLNHLNKAEQDRLMKTKRNQFFFAFAVIFVVTITETILEYLGILHHEIVGDGYLMSTFGKIALFGGYYAALSYWEYGIAKNIINSQDNL